VRGRSGDGGEEGRPERDAVLRLCGQVLGGTLSPLSTRRSRVEPLPPARFAPPRAARAGDRLPAGACGARSWADGLGPALLPLAIALRFCPGGVPCPANPASSSRMAFGRTDRASARSSIC